jgi:hypothetical protein
MMAPSIMTSNWKDGTREACGSTSNMTLILLFAALPFDQECLLESNVTYTVYVRLSSGVAKLPSDVQESP